MRTNESEYKRLEDTIEQLRAENAELRKDRERLDWLIDNNCEIYEPQTALLYCDCDRESIDEMMPQATH
jgi:redox-regulated HSP33 family molecular chaperone